MRSGLRVEVFPAGSDGSEFIVQAIDEWNPGGDVQPSDVRIADAVEVLDECAQGITVCCNENCAPGTEVLPDDDILPIGDESGDDIGEALGRGAGLGWQTRIPSIVGLGELAVGIDGRRRSVI